MTKFIAFLALLTLALIASACDEHDRVFRVPGSTDTLLVQSDSCVTDTIYVDRWIESGCTTTIVLHCKGRSGKCDTTSVETDCE